MNFFKIQNFPIAFPFHQILKSKSRQKVSICIITQGRRRSSWEVEQQQSKNRRPSSVVARRLKLETSNDGEGGFTIRGFFVSTGCYAVMFVMAAMFTVFGAVMLAVSYREADEEEMEEKRHSSESIVRAKPKR